MRGNDGLGIVELMPDYWPLELLVLVEPVAGKRHANHNAAVVMLRTAPGAPPG